MKKKISLLLIALSGFIYPQSNPFNRGVNLTNWFQTNGAKQIQFSKYTKQTFEQLKSIGVDVVRLPINLHSMTNGAPSYTIDSMFLFFLDQVVDWAEELDIKLIIDNHTFDVNVSTEPDIDLILIPVWTQMASHFRNRTNKIYYEVLNEPHGISDLRWNQIQQDVVSAIRTVDQIHTIIVGPAEWNSYNNLAAMPVYSDSNLIYTFHFYDPFLFTHQGANWTDLGPVSGVPFPFNAGRMPTIPSQLVNTWVQTSWNSYPTDGTIQKVYNLLGKAANFQNSRKVKLFCGEFGVFIPSSPDSDRVFWYEMVRKYLEQYNISWTIWDYQGGFGLFEKYSNELFNHDLNVPLLTALGLNVPPQSEYVKRPDSTQFSFYSDFIGQNINNISYSNGTLDFYNTENPSEGDYCIYWNGAQRYGSIAFDFQPNKDLSLLKSEGYVFDCMIRGNIPFTSFDIRFVDTKTSTSDHPWRLGYKINKSKIIFNGEWQNLRISLKDFFEFGSWDNNTWYNPSGLFDWSDIDRFEIVAEDSSLTYSQLWFDDIKIFNPNATFAADDLLLPNTFELSQNYPNPFNPNTKIHYSIPQFSSVKLKVYDLLGNEIATLVNEEKSSGNYRIEFDGHNLPSGVYFYQLLVSALQNKDGKAGNPESSSGQFFIETKKMILMK